MALFLELEIAGRYVGVGRYRNGVVVVTAVIRYVVKAAEGAGFHVVGGQTAERIEGAHSGVGSNS